MSLNSTFIEQVEEMCELSCDYQSDAGHKNNLKTLKSFVASLEAGQHPNFLEVMAAISILSDLMTESRGCCDCDVPR